MRKLSWLLSILIVFLIATEASADTVFAVTYETELGIRCNLSFDHCQPLDWFFMPSQPSTATFSLSSDQLRTPGIHDVSDSYSHEDSWNMFTTPPVAMAVVYDEALIDLLVFFTGMHFVGPFLQYEGFRAADGQFWAGKSTQALDFTQNLFGTYTISEVVPTPESGAIPAAVAALLLLIVKRERLARR